MNYSELVLSALIALRGNLLRTLLTMLGIIIGIASVIMIISLGEGATQSISNQISSFGTNLIFVVPRSPTNRGGPPAPVTTLTLADAEAIADPSFVQNVSLIVPTVAGATQVSANGQVENTTLQGVSEGYVSIQSLSLAEGEFLTAEDVDSLARVVVLGSEVVTKLYGEGAEVVGESIKIDNRSFRIVGVLAEKDASTFSNPNAAVYIPITTAMKIVLGQDYINTVLVQAENPELVNQTVEQVVTLLRNRHDVTEGKEDDFRVASSEDALATLGSVTGILTALLAGIAAISLVVGGIGIMNIMLVTVTERTKEIGLLKAIGARQKDILTQFLIEALVLTLVGGAIGMVLGVSFAFLITKLAGIPFILSPTAIGLAVGVSSAVGIGFGYYPAQRAAKLSPIDALRYE
jgi:putative ABC transport system permease protein